MRRLKQEEARPNDLRFANRDIKNKCGAGEALPPELYSTPKAEKHKRRTGRPQPHICDATKGVVEGAT